MIRAVERADATFQVLDALGRNRRKRRQRGEFLVHGVRPIDALRAHGWPLSGVISAAGRRRSRWADGVVASRGDAPWYELAPALFDELAERDEPGELIAVARIPPRSLTDIDGDGPVLVLDRPSSPGNLGSLVRSADAFGAAGVVVLGHAADPYDPRAIRASVGSLFAVPVVEVGGAAELAPWLEASARRVIGLDEAAPSALADVPAGRLALVMGNEGRGLAVGARALCNQLVSIPMQGAATSLNLAVAGSIALYQLDAPDVTEPADDLGDVVNTGRLLASARAAGAGAVASGRWLTETVIDLAPRIPIRDLATLQAHHGGLTGPALGDAVIKSAARASAAIGAAAGALASAEELAPPAWLALPLELVVETAVLAALEMKLVAELHAVYERPIAGSPGDRATAIVWAWVERRGVTAASRSAGTQLVRAVRRRLLRRLGRNLSTLAPLLIGAVAGAEVNRRATRDLGAAVVEDLAGRGR